MTSTLPGLKSVVASLASRAEHELTDLLATLGPNAVLSMPWLFEMWALAHQEPPRRDWQTWVILGGRGAGKTRAGAEWIRSEVEGAKPLDAGRSCRIALVAETLDQARDVMVFGESGILASSPPDRRPAWQATRRRLEWPNGATAQIFSASDPESLRGPQFDCAWSDELAKWKKGQEAWDMLQFGLRLGEEPRQIVTTTPRRNPLLVDLMGADGTVVSSAPTEANRANLAPSFLKLVTAKYGETWLGRQELGGELLQDEPDALWRRGDLERQRLGTPPALDRIVVAIDPPVTSGAKSDACGIVVAGVVMQGPPMEWRAYVLEDASIAAASPQAWAERTVERFHAHGADRLVAEVNQGGDLVETLVRQIDPLIPYRAVRASRGKAARAEPVAALYEQGRVHHVGAHPALEDEMCAMSLSGYAGRGSPDRLDALVWAVTDLMIEPAAGAVAARIRTL